MEILQIWTRLGEWAVENAMIINAQGPRASLDAASYQIWADVLPLSS
jgi:hypothetical protein